MDNDGSVSQEISSFAKYHTRDQCEEHVLGGNQCETVLGSPASGAPEQVGTRSCMVTDDSHCLVTTSPNGATYWTPLCAEHLTPKHEQIFQSIEAGIHFYRTYAAACNFEVRLGNEKHFIDGRVKSKNVFCNKQGSSNSKPDLTIRGAAFKRVLKYTRCNCRAKVVFKFKENWGYIISEFHSAHNHQIAITSAAHFLNSRRSLSFGQKSLMAACSRANIGPSSAFKLAKEMAGGFPNVGCILKDFENHQRDVVGYVGVHDAQMVIDRFTNKKQTNCEFFFEYCIDDNALTRIFWADPIARRNYRAYGDVVSFDATYALNRYNMVFVPFTGVDNHMNSITFGAGLLSGEDTSSYTWILETFIRCMGKAPTIVLTDEDAALKSVIPKVMPNTHHRLCLWHIMKKLPQKVGFVTERQISFGKCLKNLIYEYYVDPVEFEDKWKALMLEYEMTNHAWLKDKYNSRSSWIPCYFKDIPLGGLLRTTSRSESANSFFNGFLKHGMTLLAVMTGFDSAMDSQRNRQSKYDHDTRIKFPKIATPLEVEKQASEVYTYSVFRLCQEEIVASCYTVSVCGVSISEGVAIYTLRDNQHPHITFQVHVTDENSTFQCSCKYFEKVGLLCRHVFASFKSIGMNKISAKYILDRWTRNAFVYANADLDKYSVDNSGAIHDLNKQCTDVWLEFKACIEIVGNDVRKKDQMLSLVKGMRSTLEAANSGQLPKDNSQMIAELIGAPHPKEVTVLPPKLVYTKGSGKRIVGEAESQCKSKRPPRLCKICKKPGHDTRTCDANPKNEARYIFPTLEENLPSLPT